MLVRLRKERRHHGSAAGTGPDPQPRPLVTGIISLTNLRPLCPYLLMPVATHPHTPTTDPDPPRPTPAMPAAIGRVLSVVRKLIDYGKQLASTVQQRATAPDFARFASRF